MDCQRVNESLPWLLNGTLEAAEQQAARAHLAQCAACQHELRDTLFAASVFQQHVPAEALVSYAFDRPSLAEERELIERHLSTCQPCADELELVRESRRLEESEEKAEAAALAEQSERTAEVRPFVPRKLNVWPMRVWQYGALAASLAGLFAIGGWLWSLQQAGSLRASLREQGERLALTEAENARLRQTAQPTPVEQAADQSRQQIAQLQARVKELSAPQVNLPVLEIFPQELAQRTGRVQVNQLQIPRGAKNVILILNSQRASESKRLSLELLDARQQVVWSQPGLTRHSTGDYTINLPTEFLAPGNYTFNVYDQAGGKRVKLESYRIRVAQAGR